VVEAPGSLGYSTTYAYNLQDNLTGVQQGTQTARAFVYDSASRLQSATNPESNTTQYGYDYNGNLTVKTDGRAITTSRGYDALDRVSSISSGGQTLARFCYDGQAATSAACTGSPAVKGVLTGVWSPASTTSYGPDALGRITASTQSTDGAPFGFSYQYNVDGSVKTLSYPSGRSVAYEYDQAGRVNAVAGYASSVAYAPQGALAQMALANGVVESWTYNQRLQAESMTAAKAGTLLGLSYGYAATGNNGNVLSQTINAAGLASFTQSYQYDALNRLAQVQETASGAASGSWWAAFGYGHYGNLWVSGASFTLNLAAPVAQSQYNEATNRLAKTWDNQPLPGDAYDGAGNLKNHPYVGQMSYDWDNRLVGFLKAGASVEFAYDGEGRRVKKVAGGVTTVYAYDAQGQLVAEYGPLAAIGGRQYLTADHLGSTRLVTDESGAVKQRRDYLPFGEEILANSSFGNRQVVKDGQAQTTYNAPYGPAQQFTGKERDADTGLDYFGARYFSGAQGRFTNPDPLLAKKEWLADPQRWNRYAYVRNNPIRFADPNGEDLIVYYWDSQNLTDEQREWLRQNRQEVFDTIRDRFNKAGIKKVEFRPGSSLSKEQIGQLPGRLGIGQLNFQNTTNVVGEQFGVRAKGETLGRSGVGMGPSEVFLGNLTDVSFFGLRVPGFGLSENDLAVGAGEVGAHELGHRLGFEAVRESMYRLRPDNLMTEGMGNPNPSHPLYFKPTKDDRRIIEEVNAIGDNTPKRRE